jgi:integrase/recombinase XerD
VTNDLLQARVKAYLELRQSFGYRTSAHQHALQSFARYLATQEQPWPIRAEVALDWARQASARCYQTGATARLGIVRGFLIYLKAFEPGTEVPPSGLVAGSRRPKAHLYSPQQIHRMMEATLNWSWEPGSFRQKTFRTVVGLLASTGLRIGEVLRLTLEHAHLDYDPPYLEIRDTKFHKCRLVPLHPTAAVKLQEYLAERVRHIHGSAATTFFINDHGRPLRYYLVWRAIVEAQQEAGIIKEAHPGRRGPAMHALRHTFAVERLLAWYRAGADLRAQLPRLSVYLGHVGMEETYRYLSATPELLTVAGERFARYAESGGHL